MEKMDEKTWKEQIEKKFNTQDNFRMNKSMGQKAVVWPWSSPSASAPGLKQSYPVTFRWKVFEPVN